jgi:hypothetical protein
MHATDLVGINGITRVLLVYTCQQGVYPRGHVLPLRLLDIIHYLSLIKTLIKTRRFGDWNLSAPSGEAYSVGPNRYR